MNSSRQQPRVAVIGAGMAGAACARALSASGHAVHVFDKSRGPGGRLATRRVEWIDAAGQPRTARLDHGAPAFTAHSPSLRWFAGAAVEAGWLARWAPVSAASAQSLPPADSGPHFVPVPDMPSLCRHLLDGCSATWACRVDRLQCGSRGWQLHSQGALLADGFDAVTIALPPAQAAPLLAPHHRDWAQRAALALMQPCWTLMGVARAPRQALDWDIARPAHGPLARVARNESRPGRDAPAGELHWVVHARAAWSREHLEREPEWVRLQMQAALDAWLGEPVAWQHAVVHRWRYAMPLSATHAPSGQCWWDPRLGLGVCGDFLGHAGVEGAWLSAHALAQALAAERPHGAAFAARAATDRTAQQLAA